MGDDLTYQQDNILELLNQHVKILNDELDDLDRKAEINIGVGSIVVGLISALNLNQVHSPAANFFLGIAMLAYVGGFILSFAALAPRRFRSYPLEPTLEQAQRILIDKQNVQDYYRWLLDAYTTILEIAAEPRKMKARLVRYARLCGGLVILAVILAKLFA